MQFEKKHTDKSTKPIVIRNIQELRATLYQYRKTDETIALVPTMGALHVGHMALVTRAKALADKVVVSIFVNPTQFSASDDLDQYPRTETADLESLKEASVDIVFIPNVGEVYAEGFATSVHVAGPSMGLESDTRPEFFTGVATVVCKLLLQCLPDFAVFGEKDYQQLQVVRRMVCDLDIPSQIISVPTVRESDGVACSSRNTYLTSAERQVAPKLYAILSETAGRIRSDGNVAAELKLCEQRLLAESFTDVEYITLCDGDTMEAISAPTKGARLLLAVRLGSTRLIDNIEV